VVPVISDSCSGRSGCSGGFVPVVPFRLFRVLVHACFSKELLCENTLLQTSHFLDMVSGFQLLIFPTYAGMLRRALEFQLKISPNRSLKSAFTESL
jgi:hypothetical protein